jgi:hypothetical protein
MGDLPPELLHRFAVEQIETSHHNAMFPDRCQPPRLASTEEICMSRLTALATTILVLLLAVPGAADFELPLTITETKGSGGRKHVSNGVPLLLGQAQEIDELHVIGPDGKEVPNQFRVLARYWRDDNSIRWVLVDFIGSVPSNGHAVYTLVGRKNKADRPATKMKLQETDAAFVIDTGAAKFEIDRKKFNLLNRVWVDKEGDGQYGNDELIVPADPTHGSVVEDPEGRKYYSSLGTGFVKVIDSGPVRVTLLAKGVHVSEEQGAFKPGLYGYEVFLTFYAGEPHVDVDAILTNNFREPIG